MTGCHVHDYVSQDPGATGWMAPLAGPEEAGMWGARHGLMGDTEGAPGAVDPDRTRPGKRVRVQTRAVKGTGDDSLVRTPSRAAEPNTRVHVY